MLTCAIKCFMKCSACSLITPYPFGEISEDPTVIRRPGSTHLNNNGPCTLSTAPCMLPQIYKSENMTKNYDCIELFSLESIDNRIMMLANGWLTYLFKSRVRIIC